ncbi:STAS domain-containing protein [Nonomuraea soli]|uniref:Anti-sigma factor antagonist n=1 Tax=Nonomuraea soli TaxID=1032476 RepID=A0A7W0CVI5_9ACTN|nr:STAS domain-containing protein [Nonomuraea soli]MBA2897899.1 anti-sigma B factor antagonist [Nonomuraea soli]
MTELDITVSEFGRYRLVSLRGEIDITNSDRLRDRIAMAITTATGGLVIDLAEVRFCDASGLRALVLSHRRAHDRALPLQIAGAVGPVARILDLMGFSQAWPVHADVAGAVRKLDALLESDPGERTCPAV